MSRFFLVFACALPLLAIADPDHLFPLATETPPAWDRKENTAVERLAEEDSMPGGAVRVTIGTDEFSFGWINRLFPDSDYADAVGLHGFFRSSGGGMLLGHILLLEPQGPPSYFRADLGQLQDSQGEWVEFFIDFRAMRYERGSQQSFQPAQLGPRAKIQFLAQASRRQPFSFDIGGLAMLDAAQAAPLARRLARERLRRELIPEDQIVDSPHPRLLLGDAEVEALHAAIARHPNLAEARDRILQLAEAELRHRTVDQLWERVLSFREDTDKPSDPHARRGAFEGRFTPAVTPLETLAVAYRITADERFGRRAAELALRMARELTVDNPLIDEGFYYTRTFYVRALAFAYDWTHDLLAPAERQDIKTTLLGFVLDIHERSQTAGWGRRPLHRVWNWDPGLMGAAGVAMLALEGETRTAEKAILFECRRHLRDYLTLGIDRDGSGNEGPPYIGYGMGAGVHFVEILRRQGRDDLFVNSNYHLTPPWFVAETLPGGGRWNNLSDGGHGQAPWPAYSYVCGRLAELAESDPRRVGERLASPTIRQPFDLLAQFSETLGERQLSYAALAGLMSWVWENGPGIGSPSQFDGPQALGYLLFWRPYPALDPAAVLPLGQHFRGRGLVVSRTGFGSEDWHISVLAGPYVAGHDQCDKGSFTLRAYGADLAIDSGYGNDGDPEKSHSSFAHNMVLIDGEGQPMHYHNQSSGWITGFHHSDLLDWVRVDAREAWSLRYDTNWRPIPTNPVERAERAFLFLRENHGVPPYLVVMDDIVKDDAERDYTWQWHIPSNMAFATDSLPWRAEPQRLRFPVLRAPETNARAEFTFTVDTAGTYQLAALTRAGGQDLGKSDSFFVTLGDGPRITWDIPATATLNWSPVMHRGAAGPATFALEPGTHLVRLDKREPEAELAKLALLPAAAEIPLSPYAEPSVGQVLPATDANRGEPPFPLVPAGTVQGPEVTLEVFPVRPGGGKVATDWFETSREGSHPRLHYTVRSRAPRFLMVLLPRKAGIPRPEVVPDGDWGARIVWGDTADIIRFERLPGAEYGGATFRRERRGQTLAEAWLDATRDGKPTVATRQN